MDPWLHQKCSDIHINKIARLMDEWEKAAAYFNVSKAEQIEIKKDHCNDYGQQKREFLQTWRRKNGDKATLRELLYCLKEAGENKLLQSVNEMFGVGVAQRVEDTPIVCNPDHVMTAAVAMDSPVVVEGTKSPSSDVVRAVFRNHLADLAQSLSSNITDFCNRLESASLIDDDLSDEIMSTMGVGKVEKARQLLKAVQKLMNKDVNDPPTIFIKLCGVLSRYKTAEAIAKQMMEEAGMEASDDQQKLGNKAPTAPVLLPFTSSRHDYSEFTTANYGSPKLKELLHYINEIPDCWENVGIQLELSQSQLNAIRMKISNGGLAVNFFKDVFIQWEQANDPDVPYSWKTFLEALSSSFVNKIPLADRIAEELRVRRNN